MTEKKEEVVVELQSNVHIAVFDIVHTESGRKARGGGSLEQCTSREKKR